MQPNTPTPVRGVGTTERYSSHCADDNGPADSRTQFERSVVNRQNLVTRRAKPRRRSR